MSRGRSSLLTKEEIAASLEVCMEKKLLDKITIIDITESSGVSRQMFYHYFSDRIELIQYLCRKYVKSPLYEDQMFYWERAVMQMLKSKEEHSENYHRLLHSKYSNVLKRVVHEELYLLYYCVIRYRICRTLPKELSEMLERYCEQSAEIFCAWLDKDRTESAESVRAQMRQVMPRQLEILLTERAISLQDIFRERSLLNWAYECK